MRKYIVEAQNYIPHGMAHNQFELVLNDLKLDFVKLRTIPPIKKYIYFTTLTLRRALSMLYL